MFPGFVARSRSNPASELTSADAWRDLWMAARDRLVGAGATQAVPLEHRLRGVRLTRPRRRCDS